MQSTPLSTSEQELMSRWMERVARYQAGDQAAMPPEVIAIGTLRIFGRSGDVPLPFPQIRAIADLQRLPEDAATAMAIANRTVAAYRARGNGRMVYATAPGATQADPIEQIDPTRHSDVLIVGPIAGG